MPFAIPPATTSSSSLTHPLTYTHTEAKDYVMACALPARRGWDSSHICARAKPPEMRRGTESGRHSMGRDPASRQRCLSTRLPVCILPMSLQQAQPNVASAAWACPKPRWLIDSAVYPEKLSARRLACMRPDRVEREEMNRVIVDEPVYGVFEPAAAETFQRVMARMRDAGCDAVVPGCTEIPLSMNDAHSPLPTLDSTRLLARAAMDHAVRRAARQPRVASALSARGRVHHARGRARFPHRLRRGRPLPSRRYAAPCRPADGCRPASPCRP